MKKLQLLLLSLLLVSNLAVYAAPTVDGTLSITMAAAPAVGVSIPRIMVMRSFTNARHFTLNWGDNWMQSMPSGNYKILPFLVRNGRSYYRAPSRMVIVPPAGVANVLITYAPV